MQTPLSLTTKNCLFAATLAGLASLLMPLHIVLMAVLVLALVWATVVDLKSHRIPNYISYPACLATLVALLVSQHAFALEKPIVVASLSKALYGGCVCFAIAFIVWLCGGFGGGDAKLTLLIGMVLGAEHGLVAFLLAQLLAASFIFWNQAVDAVVFGWKGIRKIDVLPMAGFYSLACLLVSIGVFLR